MLRTFLLMTILLFAASPGHAEDFDGKDWTLSIGSGTLGAAVGAGGLGLLAAATSDENDFSALGLVVLGIVVGAPIGATAGVWLYGDLSGHDSRWWAPIVGGLVGGGIGLGGFIGALQIDQEVLSGTLGFTSLLVLPAVGATLGYALGLESKGEVSWGAPQLMVAPDGAGGLRAQALLVDLRF